MKTTDNCHLRTSYFNTLLLTFQMFAISVWILTVSLDGPVAGTDETNGGICDEDALTITVSCTTH